jgi:hypothetical protein
MLEWFKDFFKYKFTEEIPPALERCEFNCRVQECSYGKWVECEKRIKEMEIAIRASNETKHVRERN